ncbi:hypothetical protein K402DRAFT_459153 [Aulographum hederae CBS 113979]|uniref:Septin-type G domain-containing protein n=1 Tax=Aulographum hederae CBS 113979 TaxID=1176131 RepID=A0A6G1HFX6_9PEZI|nr:hypothetical protein K402DRAFT_459153 [Aulographum hederae CBS 113979]
MRPPTAGAPFGDPPPLNSIMSKQTTAQMFEKHGRRDSSGASGSSPSGLMTGSDGPVSFELRTEEEIEQAFGAGKRDSDTGKKRDGTYGVQSLDDALGKAFGKDGSVGHEKNKDADAEKEMGVLGRIGRSLSGKRKVGIGSGNGNENKTTASSSSRPGSSGDKTAEKNGELHAHGQPSSTHNRKTSTATISTPLTPLAGAVDSPFLKDAGTPSSGEEGSMRSLRLSDDDSILDDSVSQALASSGDENEELEDEESQGEEDLSMETEMEAPELVMPRIIMPKRRPFTARGRGMGKLKVLVAGGQGSGKTSLIRSIVQVCDDIVHVDPLATSSSTTLPPLGSAQNRSRRRSSGNCVEHISEVHASTRAYPTWWSEMEESRLLRRRKSMGDTVLERNLCFIDTPGYRGESELIGLDPQGRIDLVVRYIEGLMHRNASIVGLSEGDLLSILSGNGGVQVDVVLYLFSAENLPNDLGYFRQLSKLTNAIPLISKADLLSVDEITELKIQILQGLQDSSSRSFLFGRTTLEATNAARSFATQYPESNPSSSVGIITTPTSSSNPLSPPASPNSFPPAIAPFTVSSLPGPDTDTIDASILMSPDYTAPPLASELTSLVTQLFDPENISWLRHTAARKFIVWRRDRLASGLDIGGGGDSLFMGIGATPASNVSRTSSTAPPLSSPTLTSRLGNDDASSFLSSPSISPSAVLVSRTPISHASLPLTTHPNSAISSPALGPIGGGSDAGSGLGIGATSYALARLQDHTLREERLAQVRLAKWAEDLQKSVRIERERFEELMRGERTRWLLERVGEEVGDGSDGDESAGKKTAGRAGAAGWAKALLLHGCSGYGEGEDDGEKQLARWARKRNHSSRKTATSISKSGENVGRRFRDPRDPLGLFEEGSGVSIAVRILGGVGLGVLGAVVMAVVRGGGSEGGLAGWMESAYGLGERVVAWGWSGC